MDYGLFFFHSVSVSEHLPACAAVASVSHTCKICLSLPTLGLNFGRLDYLASGCQEMPLLSFRRLMIFISVWLAKLMIAAQPGRICSMVSKLGTVPMTINVILTTPRPGIFLMGHSGVTRPWGIPSHRPWASLGSMLHGPPGFGSQLARCSFSGPGVSVEPRADDDRWVEEHRCYMEFICFF